MNAEITIVDTRAGSRLRCCKPCWISTRCAGRDGFICRNLWFSTASFSPDGRYLAAPASDRKWAIKSGSGCGNQFRSRTEKGGTTSFLRNSSR